MIPPVFCSEAVHYYHLVFVLFNFLVFGLLFSTIPRDWRFSVFWDVKPELGQY